MKKLAYIDISKHANKEQLSLGNQSFKQLPLRYARLFFRHTLCMS
jgi:hypothetical protein